MSLFTELKRRNVFRVGVLYIVTAWLVKKTARATSPRASARQRSRAREKSRNQRRRSTTATKVRMKVLMTRVCRISPGASQTHASASA